MKTTPQETGIDVHQFYQDEINRLERELAAALEKVETMRGAISEALSSASPNCNDHPTMFAAWKRMQQALAKPLDGPGRATERSLTLISHAAHSSHLSEERFRRRQHTKKSQGGSGEKSLLPFLYPAMKDLHKAAIPFLMGHDPDGETPMFDGLPDDFVVFAYRGMDHDMYLTAGDFRALADAMSMAGPNASIVIGALDSMGTALAAHGHTWDEGERAIFEQAHDIMGGPPPAFTDAEPPEDSADYWKK